MRSIIQQRLFTGIALAGLLASPLVLSATTAKKGARPFLGIAAEAVEGDAAPAGIIVQSVVPDGPAGKAGLKSSDRIVMADGKEVKTFEALKKVVADHKPGDKIALKVLRDGKEESITVTLAAARHTHEEAAVPANKPHVYLGVFSQAMTAELKSTMELNVDKGVLIMQVMPGSPAAKAGLEREDVITHVGNQAITTPAMLSDAVQKAGAGKELTLKVARGTKTMDLKVQLQDAPAGFAEAPRLALPEGFKDFSEHFHSFSDGNGKLSTVEKKLQELENRVRELEQKASR